MHSTKEYIENISAVTSDIKFMCMRFKIRDKDSAGFRTNEALC
jgi:hypothetical protein